MSPEQFAELEASLRRGEPVINGQTALEMIEHTRAHAAGDINATLLAEVKEYRRTVAYYISVDEAAEDPEGARLKAIKLSLLDLLIAEAELVS